MGGKQKKAFVFTYIDKNNVEQQHTFFNFSPYLGTQSSTRERGTDYYGMVGGGIRFTLSGRSFAGG
ncbi:hypothetical protein NXX19_26360 [Bacteroides ovatus]|nr:hypothetical protein [Bacteroides ovatus]